MDALVLSGRPIRGYAMNCHYIIFSLPAPGRSSSTPDKMVATRARINGQWQPFIFRGSTLGKSIRNKAFGAEPFFLFMNAAEVVRAWRNDDVTCRQGLCDILLVPVTSSLTGPSKHVQASLDRGNGTSEDNRAGVLYGLQDPRRLCLLAIWGISPFCALAITGILLK